MTPLEKSETVFLVWQGSYDSRRLQGVCRSYAAAELKAGEMAEEIEVPASEWRSLESDPDMKIEIEEWPISGAVD
jgi:hypothetical protein